MLKRLNKLKLLLPLLILGCILLVVYSSRQKSEVQTDVQFIQDKFPNIKDIEEVRYYYKVTSNQREIGLQSIEFCGFIKLGNDFYEKIVQDYDWKETKKSKKIVPKTVLMEGDVFFARIVDYKSPFTSTHSIGVAEDAEKLSRHMGFDEETVQKMYLAGALHDIGKVAIGNEILEKPGKLTDEEFKTMKHHAAYTYYILSDIDDFEEIRDWAAFHHERLDGTGYPFGRSAAELNTQERIMACVDIYQALTESRPYKQGMTHEKASSILWDMAKKGWIDGDIVREVDSCFATI